MGVLFTDIQDELLAELGPEFVAIIESMQTLKEVLAVKSYADMGKDKSKRDRLAAIEADLRTTLARPLLPTGSLDQAPLAVRRAWYSAYFVSNDYVATCATDVMTNVGDANGRAPCIASTMPLNSLPRFQARDLVADRHHLYGAELVEKLGLSAEDVAEIHVAHRERQQRLMVCHRIMATLRRLMSDDQGQLQRPLVFALFKRLFPDAPLRLNEVDVVITSTACYWALTSAEELATSDRSADELALAKQWIKGIRRFRFEQFTHFPMFSIFDARDADPTLIQELSEICAIEEIDVRERLDRGMMLENRAELEKYLIHDSWGHVWQAYLADLTKPYDHLATLQFPISADYHVTVDQHNVVCLADCFYLHSDGRLSFDEAVAMDYIHAVLEQRVAALLTPVMAELTADMVEYGFIADQQRCDDPEARKVLPSSSLFSHNPAKIDFAWADMQYFARALRRPIRQYQKNERLREGLEISLAEMLRVKYARHQGLIDEVTLAKEIHTHVARFVDRYEKVQNSLLDIDFDQTHMADVTHVNIFTRMFANLLRIQFAINTLYHDHMDAPGQDSIRQLRMVVQIFIIHYFQEDPARRFWNLDETMEKWILPLLQETAATEA